MSYQTLSLTPTLYEYLLNHTSPEHPILAALRQATYAHPQGRMAISREQAALLALLVKLMRAENILEIGCFTGYSALAMALALPITGHITTCDIDKVTTAIAKLYWQQAGLAAKIELRLAPALQTLAELHAENAVFDMVFIDADKANYSAYFEQSLALVRTGGLIIIDNVLWSGRPLDDSDQSTATCAIRELNDHLCQDPRVEVVMLPVGDGMTLIYKR